MHHPFDMSGHTVGHDIARQWSNVHVVNEHWQWLGQLHRVGNESIYSQLVNTLWLVRHDIARWLVIGGWFYAGHRIGADRIRHVVSFSFLFSLCCHDRLRVNDAMLWAMVGAEIHTGKELYHGNVYQNCAAQHNSKIDFN
jgi:hypothetical protein